MVAVSYTHLDVYKRQLYPDADEEFESQFISVANRQLEVVQLLGGKTNPWKAPNMAYRAFNLLTGKPVSYTHL